MRWPPTGRRVLHDALVSPAARLAEGVYAVIPLVNELLHVCPQGKQGDVEGRFVIRAVPVMEVGPPGSPCRRGVQTTVMSCRSKAGVAGGDPVAGRAHRGRQRWSEKER